METQARNEAAAGGEPAPAPMAAGQADRGGGQVLAGGEPEGASPFADPEYGMGHGEGPICSHPRWSLEENQSAWTGWVGAGVVLLAAWVFAGTRGVPSLPLGLQEVLGAWRPRVNEWFAEAWGWRHQLVLLGVFFAMFLVETLVFKVHRRHFEFGRVRVVDGAAWARILGRWMAILFCIFLAVALYFCLDEYKFYQYPAFEILTGRLDGSKAPPHFYAKYIQFFWVAVVALAVFCLPYFWLVERHARADGPVDEFLVLYRCLTRGLAGLLVPGFRGEFWRALRNEHVHNLFRGLLVKFFFIPLMMIWCVNSWGSWEESTYQFSQLPPLVWSDPHHVAMTMRQLHYSCTNLLITMDLTIALIGYLASVRLLDTQVTTAEPTFFGWAMALLCYPPFNMQITSLYFQYDSGQRWETLLVDHPLLCILASCVMIFLWGIYAWATVAFGMRFSNLTNRGILFSGPYRYIRHPAYISKGVTWWVQSLPMFTAGSLGFFHSLHLFVINVIYGLRAWTEERHLMREPHYREYCKRVRWRFIPGIF